MGRFAGDEVSAQVISAVSIGSTSWTSTLTRLSTGQETDSCNASSVIARTTRLLGRT